MPPASRSPAAPSRLGFVALLVLCAALLAAACGGGDGAGGDAAAANAAPPADGETIPTLPPGRPDSGEPDAEADVEDPGEAPETTPSAPLRGFSIAASGDILIHAPVMASAQANAGGSGYDFDPMFDDVRELISSADLAICHQEGPISYDNTSLTGYPLFNAPREIAVALHNAGFDACEQVSNHTLDKGFTGFKSTLDVFDEVGIQHPGGRTPQELEAGAIYEVNGVRIGHTAFTYGFNGIPVPGDAPWMAGLLYHEVGLEGVLERARSLRLRGAEFVVLSMQWGNEYQQAPTDEQRQWARDLLSSPDVDLILGDHVHVIQPCEQIEGKYVHYGMGNFLSNQTPAAGLLASTQDGAVVRYEVQEVAPGQFRTVRMSFAPTFVTVPGHRIERATPERHPNSHGRTVEAFAALGPGACDAVPEY